MPPLPPPTTHHDVVLLTSQETRVPLVLHQIVIFFIQEIVVMTGRVHGCRSSQVSFSVSIIVNQAFDVLIKPAQINIHMVTVS